MIEPNFVEDMDMDCGNFFDHIDDLLDFPCEDLEAGLGTGDYSSFAEAWPTHSDSLPDSDAIFSGKSNSDVSAELFVPYEDIVQLEWLSSFTDDSSGAGNNLTAAKDSCSHFRTLSPVSVLESSSSCSGTKPSAVDGPHSPQAVASSPAKRGRPRTKRPRPVKQCSDEKFEKEAQKPLNLDVAAETRLVIRIPKRVLTDHDAAKKTATKKKKKIEDNSWTPKGNNAHEDENAGEAQPVRKCAHCEITKTPQWRAGPAGPKTLCNACGVRYKSGRLFPEYRPAASPTFVPSLHSNSHKKVVEMRGKRPEKGDETRRSRLSQLIPNENALLRLDYA